MTAKETLDWMRNESILKHWILPEQNLNKGTRYENSPTGNAPEFNALDSNCNRDLHCAVLEHVSHTASLPNTDEQKFSVSTPKHQDSAYLRLWDPSLQLEQGWEAGVPCSRRILQDMTRIPTYSILKRLEVRGAVVHGCGTRRGRRNDGRRDVGNWGGARERKPLAERFMHPDAISAVEEGIEQSVFKWNGNEQMNVIPFELNNDLTHEEGNVEGEEI